MTQLRCSNEILFGVLISPEMVEVKCRSARCGAERGVVVLHRFSTVSGELIETRKYRTLESG